MKSIKDQMATLFPDFAVSKPCTTRKTTITPKQITEQDVMKLEQEVLADKSIIMNYCAFLNKNPTMKQRHHWLSKLLE